MRKMRRLQVCREPMKQATKVKIIGSRLLYGNFAVYARKPVRTKGRGCWRFFRAYAPSPPLRRAGTSGRLRSGGDGVDDEVSRGSSVKRTR